MINDEKIKKVSPLRQVIKYKNEFYDISISFWLLEIRLENKIKTNKDTVFWNDRNLSFFI